MDLALYFRVLRRFRVFIGIGLVLAVTLAFLSFVRVSFNGKPKLAYRQQETWTSYSTLLISQQGYPYARVDVGSNAGGTKASQFADPSRFSYLAYVYSNLADSDPVRKIRLQYGPLRGKIEAAPILASDSGSTALPLISIAASAHTRGDALTLAKSETRAFLAFLRQAQNKAKIAPSDRVLVSLVKQLKPKLTKPRSLALPIVAFMAVMIIVLGLAFILENSRPGVVRPVETKRPLPAVEASRRVASG